MRRVSLAIGLIVVGVVATLLAGCGGGDQGGGGGGGETVTIVSDLPRQGSNRAQTTTMVNAIEMAIDERGGKAGNVNIDYEGYDDAYDGVLGTWSFDDDGDTSLTELSVQQVKNGQFEYQRTIDAGEM